MSTMGESGPHPQASGWSPDSSRPLALQLYHVRVVLDEADRDGPHLDELKLHLADHQPVISRNGPGRTEITLEVRSQDIWLSVLTVLAGVKRSRYEPCSIQVVRGEEFAPGTR